MSRCVRLPSFNTQPPEGGWDSLWFCLISLVIVSTHSRLKAAGMMVYQKAVDIGVSTHSRLKAAGTEYLEDNNRP